ncbi:hypothetical protein ABZX30_28850 [Streptomyces sp. NPDC004542]|uniref:hypothetical protein n=1 Tax=Streptomyces sp. NPDC004542 TaxID=3154281 RepID=UPI0033A03D49
MSRFELTGHDRYRIEAARRDLAAAERLDMSDDRAMARTIGRLEVALRQLLEMVDETAAERGGGPVPTVGPTGVQNVHDDAPVPYAVVRLDYRVSRVELFAALVLGFTETDPDRDPDALTVEEIRRDVEAVLAGSSFSEVWLMVERLERGGFSAVRDRGMQALERALVRAYPAGVES